VSERETLLAVDGNNLLFRAIKAGEARGLELTHDGINTGPLMLFIGLLSKYVRYVKPTRVAVCFDGGVSLRRLAIYPEYKGQRVQRTDDQEEAKNGAFGLVKQWLALANVFASEVPHYEADDLIGYYWRACARMNYVVLSGDKDLLQLVSPDCYQIRPQQGFARVEDEVWDLARVSGEYGVGPEKLTVIKALMGDKSDNIMGVPGVGPKRAVQIAESAGFILSKLQFHPKVGEANADLVQRNYDLMDLRNVLGLDLPEPPSFRPTMPGSMMWSDLEDFYARLGMASMKAKQFTLWSD
jgi:DNA polymerase-1